MVRKQRLPSLLTNVLFTMEKSQHSISSHLTDIINSQAKFIDEQYEKINKLEQKLYNYENGDLAKENSKLDGMT